MAEFFGGYWHDEDFGLAHCSAYGDKPGRKIWIWVLARQGMIWEDLLTDADGQYVAGDSDILTRPTAGPPGFDWKSIYGLFLKGQEDARQLAYVQAAEEFQSCLKQDPNYLPALVELAALANRRADPAAALDFVRRALSIDTYDPGANYQFGLASAALVTAPPGTALAWPRPGQRQRESHRQYPQPRRPATLRLRPTAPGRRRRCGRRADRPARTRPAQPLRAF